MNAIVNGRILLPDRMVEGHALLYTNKIVGVVPVEQIPADTVCIDAHGGYVAAGLIDLHIHGFGGIDVCYGDPDALRELDEMMLQNGVTGWLATTPTADEATLRRTFDACRRVMAEGGHALLGVHAEGPYINPAKAGAQNVADIRSPNPAFIKEYADVIKLLTLAPEMDYDLAAIRELKQDTDIVLSMGHTDADYDTAKKAIAAGVSHATHLFNAMPPIHHREPGAVTAALTADVSCELIADLYHVHPALYDLVWRLKGRRLCLVTDCLSAAYSRDRGGRLGTQAIEQRGRLCYLFTGAVNHVPHNAIIAGSTLRLWEAVCNLASHSSIPLWECFNCASLNPATVLGIADRKGSLEAGKDADIIVTGMHLKPTTVICGGKPVICDGKIV